MKCFQALVAAVVLSAPVLGVDPGAVGQVVGLITQLKAKIEADGKMEQKSYDKFACWCEKTLERKAKDIDDAKKKIEDLQALIEKLMAETATYDVEIKQLEKDIAANLEAQREATELREKENLEYEGEKNESEQCIGALEAAVGVLTGAGAGKKAFLATFQEAQLLSVVGGIKDLLRRPAVTATMSGEDLAVVNRFVSSPQDFVSRPSEEVAALQLQNNPFGDYAPQSTQIQGILKGMYDAFTGSLEKANAEEADSVKAHEALMATKKQEQATLEAALAKFTKLNADKKKLLADSRTELDATKQQLEADEKFFAETKASCKAKASEWAERSRLRTMELKGIMQAIEILSSDEATKTFQRATTTLLQLSATPHTKRQSTAFNKLRALATKYASIGLAQIAAEVKTGGHFDEIIASIDKMIALLRKEGEEDKAHKDRCETGSTKNSEEQEDLGTDIEKAKKELEIANNEKATQEEKLAAIEAQIEETKKQMDDRLEMRNKEELAFKKALKDDAAAIALLADAIVSITAFYKTNKIPLGFLQKKEPEYTVDEDKAPETSWEGGSYGGTGSESGGIIAILGMLKEDFEMDMKTGRKDDAAAQAAYEKDLKAMTETMEALDESKIAAETAIADLASKIADLEEHLGMKDNNQKDAEKMGEALKNDCAWVETHFDSRAEKRQKEIDGLIDAKGYLAGAADE